MSTKKALKQAAAAKLLAEQSAAAELLRAERVPAAKVLMQARMPPEFTTTPQLLEAEQSAELLLQAEQSAAAAFVSSMYKHSTRSREQLGLSQCRSRIE
jgi:hypothetical protein